MPSFMLSRDNLKTLKSDIRRIYQIPSAHLSESLALALGFRTHASLLSKINSTEFLSEPVPISDAIFMQRISELGFELPSDWIGFSSFVSAHMIPSETDEEYFMKSNTISAMESGISPFGYIRFCELMGWSIIPGSKKCADLAYPAGFNIVSPKGFKVRAFVYNISHDSGRIGNLMRLTSDFCKQDGWERALLFYNSRMIVQQGPDKISTVVGMLYIAKSDSWLPMFVTRSMHSVDILFDVNSRIDLNPSTIGDVKMDIIDQGHVAADIFDKYVGV